MFKKTLAAFAVATTVMGAGAAMAQGDFFGANPTQSASDVVVINDFNSPAAGVVEIYDFRLGVIGDMLGKADVTAGANSTVRVNMVHNPLGNVMAILKNGDSVVGAEMIKIDS